MAGRKKKVLACNNKHLTKEEIEEREKLEETVSQDFQKLQKSAPNHLNSIAKAEYKRIINDLYRLPLVNLDRAVLELYCTWYAIYKTIDKELNEKGVLITSEKNGSTIANPIIKTLEKATINIKSCASSLGLTVDSRMKIFIPPEQEKEKSIFDKMGG